MKRTTFPQRILDGVWERADVRGEEDCWIWKLCAGEQGYGSYSWYEDGKHGAATAHRVAWVAANGPIPEGKGVSHLCGNKTCINPAHLELLRDESRDVRRFEHLIDKTGDCWEWKGYRATTGYGMITMQRRQVCAHRFSYELYVGPIPEGLQLDHLCRNRGCVNPAHLEPVTGQENVLRGVSPAAVNARKTHCKRGHELSSTNKADRRVCRICKNDEQVKRKKKSPSAKTLKNKATNLHSKFVRARDGRCVRCGSETGQLQCAHIISRRFAATRTDERNAATLCAACHRHLTENPHEHVGFFTVWLGSWDQYRALIEKAQSSTGQRMNAAFWSAEIARLEQLLGDL